MIIALIHPLLVFLCNGVSRLLFALVLYHSRFDLPLMKMKKKPANSNAKRQNKSARNIGKQKQMKEKEKERKKSEQQKSAHNLNWWHYMENFMSHGMNWRVFASSKSFQFSMFLFNGPSKNCYLLPNLLLKHPVIY